MQELARDEVPLFSPEAVKGLEFDYVILLEVSEQSYPEGLESRHLLHIGMTRAALQLWLLSAAGTAPLSASSYPRCCPRLRVRWSPKAVLPLRRAAC